VSKGWNRLETWLALIVLGIGLVVAAVMGLHLYMTTTATPLHPDPQEIRSEVRSGPSPEWADAVEQGRQVVRAGLTEQNLPGLSVAVGAGGDIVWAEGFGWADLESRAPVTPGTRFRIGTASVALTSAAVGLLLEKDLLTLDDAIRAHVPEFPEKPWTVTLRHLMGHVSGLRNDGGDEGPLLSQRCDVSTDALEHFAASTLLFEPGTRYRFSSYGWILLSAAVEAAANEPFLAFMRRQVFEPLGMHDTLAESATGAVPDLATSYFPRYAADPRHGLHLMRPVDYSCYAGASVFHSTPSDLVRFGLAIEGGRLLRPATVQVLQTPQRLTSGEATGYGLGWDVETVDLAGEATRMVGHDGTVLGGRVASLVAFPARGLIVAVVSNISYADTEAVALRIASIFAERAPADRQAVARPRNSPARR
jgi:serine beta-lactamase-like protein LACTB, mitochondrial